MGNNQKDDMKRNEKQDQKRTDPSFGAKQPVRDDQYSSTQKQGQPPKRNP